MRSDPAAPPAAPPRRQAAKRATRRALVRAARELFAAEGLERPSLDAICERAGFTRGAFYVHFRDRDALVAAVMEEVLGELVRGVVASGGAGGDLEETVRRFVGVAGALRAAKRSRAVRFHQLLEACRRSPETEALFVRLLADARRRLEGAAGAAQRAGRATDEAGAAELSTLLLLLALGVVVADEVGLPVELEAARDALLRILGGPRGD